MTYNKVEVNAEPTGPDAPKTDPQEKASATPPSSSVEAQPGDRPSWLPEKFKSPDEMAKAYSELEAKLSKPAEPTPPSLTGQKITTQELETYSAEYAKDGKLSDATYKGLEAKGFPKAMVDQYVQGQMALAKEHLRSVQDVVGGPSEFTELIGWANGNLTPEEAAAANAILQGGEFGAIKTTLLGLKSRRDQAEGMLPGNQIQGGRQTTSGSFAPFANLKEQAAAQRDPRYKTSESYRREVEERIRISKY